MLEINSVKELYTLLKTYQELRQKNIFRNKIDYDSYQEIHNSIIDMKVCHLVDFIKTYYKGKCRCLLSSLNKIKDIGFDTESTLTFSIRYTNIGSICDTILRVYEQEPPRSLQVDSRIYDFFILEILHNMKEIINYCYADE